MKSMLIVVKQVYVHIHCLILVLSIIGCASPAAYRDPITKFQQASTIVIEAARIEYGIANKRERDALIDRLAARQKRINLEILNSKDIRVIGGDDIAARMSALDALAKHGQLLLTLASSDAPTKAKDAAISLKDAVIDLSASLTKVPPDEFKIKAENFSNIASVLIQSVLERKITLALDKAISLTEENISSLIRLIKNDMALLHERRRSILSEARVSATDKYNKELDRQVLSSEKLYQAAAEIKVVEDAWDSLPLLLSAGPSLDAMSQAHGKLVDYAKSPKNPQDLAELIEAMDTFVTRAKVIADAVRSIREIKE